MLDTSDPVLVAGDALIVRRGATLFLTDREGAGGIGLDRDGPSVDRGGGSTAVAGYLPPGAARVEVIDDRGDAHEAAVGAGVWLALLGDVGFGDDLVRYLDSAGRVVPLPIPPGERRPIDLDLRCPVCDVAAWEELGDSLGLDALCGRCGYRVTSNVVGVVELEMVEVEDGDRDDEEDDTEWGLELAVELAGLTMPVYAVAGEAASINGWGGGSGAPVSAVHVTHDDAGGELWVDSEVVRSEYDEPREEVVRRMRDQLADLIVGDELPGVTEAAFHVWVQHREREARRRVAAVVAEQRALTIDGRAEAFTFLAAEDAWIAARDHHGVRVIARARGIPADGIALERLVDPVAPQRGTTPEPTPEVATRRLVAGGDLLDRPGVLALIDRFGLTEHADTIAAAVQAGYRLVPGGDGRTRLGGLPDLAEGEQWPHTDDGIPFTFLGQVDCSALPPLTGEFAPDPPWNHRGALVRFFAHLYATAYSDRAVVLACDAHAPVVRAELPPLPDPMPESAWEPDYDDARLFREEPVSARPVLTVPVEWTLFGDTAIDAYRDFAEQLGGGRRGEQLLGHGETEQGEDPRPYEDPAAWRVLLSLPDLGVWDCGALHVVAPVEDLAAGRYDRVVAVPSMG